MKTNATATLCQLLTRNLKYLNTNYEQPVAAVGGGHTNSYINQLFAVEVNPLSATIAVITESEQHLVLLFRRTEWTTARRLCTVLWQRLSYLDPIPGRAVIVEEQHRHPVAHVICQ